MDAVHPSDDEVAAWIADDPDPATARELTDLLAAARSGDDVAAADLADRFSGPLTFGTAGLRGELGGGPHRMNRAVVIRAAAGLAGYLLAELAGEAAPRVVVGYDARHGSRQFALDTAAVLTAAGVQALLLPGPLPTPVLAFAVRHLDADAGVMVTASHNPARDNGYKVYLGGRVATGDGQGSQIVPPADAAIAAAIAAVPSVAAVPRAPSGWTVLGPELVDAYRAAAPSTATGDPASAARLRVVLTAMHGVGTPVASAVLADAGFTDVHLVTAQADPDPDFPTVAFPNPEEPGALDLATALAARVGAHLVIALDPDADRCALAVPDPRAGGAWRRLTGDETGALLGAAVAQRWSSSRAVADVPAHPAGGAEGGAQTGSAGVDGSAHTGRADGPGPVARSDDTAPPTLACSVVSSRLLARIAAAAGLRSAVTLTGFKWISRTPGLVFGYEEALGYCVDPEHVHDKDGITAALHAATLAAALHAHGRTLTDALDDLARAHGLHLTDQVSARFADVAAIPALVDGLRAAPPAALAGVPVTRVVDLAAGTDGLPPTDGVVLHTADGSRVVVRPSGTEPKVKCYLEVVDPVPADADDATLDAIRGRASARLDALAGDLRAALGL